MSRCDIAYILIESGRWEHLQEGRYRNLVSTSSALGTINAILTKFKINTVIMPNRKTAQEFVYDTFEQFWKHIEEKYKKLAHHLIL